MGTEHRIEGVDGNRQEVSVTPGSIGTRLSIDEAFKILLTFLEISEDEIRKKTRKKEVRFKRQVISYMLRWYGFTLDLIGIKIRRDHATVLHSCHVVNRDMRTDNELLEKVESLMHGKLRKHIECVTVRNVSIYARESQIKLSSLNGLHYFSSMDEVNEWVSILKSDMEAKAEAEVECHLTYMESKIAII